MGGFLSTKRGKRSKDRGLPQDVYREGKSRPKYSSNYRERVEINDRESLTHPSQVDNYAYRYSSDDDDDNGSVENDESPTSEYSPDSIEYVALGYEASEPSQSQPQPYHKSKKTSNAPVTVIAEPVCDVYGCTSNQFNDRLCEHHYTINVTDTWRRTAFRKIEKDREGECRVINCNRDRLPTRKICSLHLKRTLELIPTDKHRRAKTFKKVRERKNRMMHNNANNKKPSQLLQEILSEHFPGKFKYRKMLYSDSQDVPGTEVDALLETSKFNLVVELDENQHKPPRSKRMSNHYMWQPEEQAERYINLVYEIFERKPTIFIRLNPNQIMKFKVPLLERMLELTDLIQSILENPPTFAEMMRVKYMYFDKDWQKTLESALKDCAMRHSSRYSPY